MTTIADAPAGHEAWPDIRSIRGGMITADGVAEAIAKREESRTGRRLMYRVEDQGRGTHVRVHPALVEAVNAWYAALPSTLASVSRVLDAAMPEAASTSSRSTARDGDERVPCSRYAWCDGHSRIFPEPDGAHMRQLPFGAWAIRYLPVAEGDAPAHWSFSMPEGREWAFGDESIDAEIDSGIADLERARVELKRFLAESGEPS